jgi:hypothetical protein
MQNRISAAMAHLGEVLQMIAKMRQVSNICSSRRTLTGGGKVKIKLSCFRLLAIGGGGT